MEKNSGHPIIVIGASAGGVNALAHLIKQLPIDIPAALFVVIHTSPDGFGMLPSVLSHGAALPVKLAEDGELISQGQVYLPPADHHMLVTANAVRVVNGPRENLWRPAIDPLFRSAAVTYGAHVIGVILTGMMDDGVTGLTAVKRCGGKVIVQSPEDAAFPELPSNVLDHVVADYVLPLADIGATLDRLARESAGASPPVPKDLACENKRVERVMSRATDESKLGVLSSYSCPECGGPLWEIGDGEVHRYRCNVGHAYTAQALLADQNREIEQALWSAVRLFEERTRVLNTMAHDEAVRGRHRTAGLFEARANETTIHADRIRQLLVQGFSG